MNRRQRGRKKIARKRERKKRGSRERDKVRASMVFWSLMKSVFVKMSSY